MVRDDISAKRYAQAVFEIAYERNELSKWQRELKILSSSLKDDQVRVIMESPKIKLSDKVTTIKKILRDISPLTINLACLMVAKNRLSLLDRLEGEYNALVDAHYGRQHVEVIAAIPLQTQDIDNMKLRLASIIGDELIISSRIAPEIIGGIVLRIGDKLIDGSVRTRLRDLKRNLGEATLTSTVTDRSFG
ncbi:MAG: ATP synthase F1 subunit delta [Chloroflexota bacterium]|nr:ATP synthase F1 subunit delta [Chloroflexota bacterium]